MTGFYVVPRALRDAPALAPSGPLSEFDAFLHLVERAAFKPHAVTFRRRTIELGVGELVTTTRQLADDFGWSTGRVSRFLKRCSSDSGATHLIDTRAERDMTHITICNYSEFCGRSNSDETQADTVVERIAGTERETIETNNIDSTTRTDADLFGDPPPAQAPSKYAFDGKVIKLTEPDLERWRKIYRNIPNLEAELESLDRYYQGEAQKSGGRMGNWFVRASTALKKRDAEMALLVTGAGQSADDDMAGWSDEDRAMRKRYGMGWVPNREGGVF